MEKKEKEETLNGINSDFGVYLTVDKDGTEIMWVEKPQKMKTQGIWNIKSPLYNDSFIALPAGTIKKLTGKDIVWEDTPYYYDGKRN